MEECTEPMDRRLKEAIVHFYGKLPPCDEAFPNYAMTSNPKGMLRMNPLFSGIVDLKKRFRVILDYDPEFESMLIQIKEEPIR